ncbi:hypothetical protein RvY_12927 [Ramazzottius varieornatus]|uniref:Uncharacterized protein n=1 Tax=Ramazzottius varieornatus TaxID=947166 RepID=A0A1D1VRJ3_RAMVA|nr:hypothetical protein RvY_12927 [Ramazzottius varieornatus]
MMMVDGDQEGITKREIARIPFYNCLRKRKEFCADCRNTRDGSSGSEKIISE